MHFKMIHRKKKVDNLDINVSVEISKIVVDRIYNTILHSNVEEGGKLLGKISTNNGNVLIEVINYLDSGPRVDNSMTHLYPDGDYQEALYRLIEKLDPEIEHVGSWHSHHCNGLDSLSPNDIVGYKRSVNKSQYNLNYFLVLLITGIIKDKLNIKYYLFCRNQDTYSQLSNSQVQVIQKGSVYNQLLQSAEDVARYYNRNLSCRTSDISDTKRSLKDDADDMLREIRRRDQEWIVNSYPNVTAFKSKINGAIGWKWAITFADITLVIRYIHPKTLNIESISHALLNITYKDEEALNKQIVLDDNRFRLIEKCINQTFQNMANIRREKKI